VHGKRALSAGGGTSFNLREQKGQGVRGLGILWADTRYREIFGCPWCFFSSLLSLLFCSWFTPGFFGLEGMPIGGISHREVDDAESPIMSYQRSSALIVL
jgi:hypothetical protein